MNRLLRRKEKQQRPVKMDVILPADGDSTLRPEELGVLTPESIQSPVEGGGGGLLMELRSQCSGIHFSLIKEFFARFQAVKKWPPKAPASGKSADVARPTSQPTELQRTQDRMELRSHQQRSGIHESSQQPKPKKLQDDAYRMELRSQCSGIHESLMDLWYRMQSLLRKNARKFSPKTLRAMEMRSQCTAVHEAMTKIRDAAFSCQVKEKGETFP